MTSIDLTNWTYRDANINNLEADGNVALAVLGPVGSSKALPPQQGLTGPRHHVRCLGWPVGATGTNCDSVPGLINDGGTLYCYYVDATSNQMRLMTSTDGINWAMTTPCRAS